MKLGVKYSIALLVLICSSILQAESDSQDVHFVVLIPSYNNKQWYEKNLNSVLMQTYHNYEIIYVDDCSTDGTGELVKQYAKKHGAQGLIRLVSNKKRVGALANIYNMVHECNDSDVIILLDGDDWLAHENVLFKLSEVYATNRYWVVYTQFIQWPMEQVGWNRAYSPRQYQNPDAVRDYSPSHLRTFYAGLFKKIKKEDLIYEDDFFAMTWDMAIMLPMVEMASSGHVKFIPDVMYTYNHSNPISDHVVNLQLQRKLHAVIAAKKKYAPLTCLCD